MHDGGGTLAAGGAKGLGERDESGCAWGSGVEVAVAGRGRGRGRPGAGAVVVAVVVAVAGAGAGAGATTATGACEAPTHPATVAADTTTGHLKVTSGTPPGRLGPSRRGTPRPPWRSSDRPAAPPAWRISRRESTGPAPRTKRRGWRVEAPGWREWAPSENPCNAACRSRPSPRWHVAHRRPGVREELATATDQFRRRRRCRGPLARRARSAEMASSSWEPRPLPPSRVTVVPIVGSAIVGRSPSQPYGAVLPRVAPRQPSETV